MIENIKIRKESKSEVINKYQLEEEEKLELDRLEQLGKNLAEYINLRASELGKEEDLN